MLNFSRYDLNDLFKIGEIDRWFNERINKGYGYLVYFFFALFMVILN